MILLGFLIAGNGMCRSAGGDESTCGQRSPLVWSSGVLLYEDPEEVPQRQPHAASALASPAAWDAASDENRLRLTVIEIGEPEPETPEPSDASGTTNHEPLGQAPPDLSHIFLRQSSTLLPQGMVQYELAFNYLFQEADALVVLPGNILDMQRVRDRRFLLPLTMRYGLGEKTEIFGTLPVGLSYFERLGTGSRSDTTRAGLGDVGGGFLHQWVRESEDWPDVISSVSFTAPTGPDPYAVSPNVAALGSGFWSVTSSVNFVRSFDPLVLYGGMGYRHEFGRQFQGLEIQPGETLTYSFGLGFAVNDDLALNAELRGAFQGRTRLDGVRIANSSSEPVTLQCGYTRRLKGKTAIQPFVLFGLTDDAPDVMLGCAIIEGPLSPRCRNRRCDRIR